MHVLDFQGRVEKGEGIASRLGCPTANVAIAHGGIIPGLGVYAGKVELRGGHHGAVVCVNDGRERTTLKLEVHVLDQCLTALEGELMTVRLFYKLRALVPWKDEEQMRVLIKGDIAAARDWLREHVTVDV